VGGVARGSLAIQWRLHDRAMAEDIRLSLKLSIGAGEVTIACLGGVLDRWELLVAGDPLIQVAPANALAHPGDVVLSPAAWHFAETACDGEPLADGFRKLRAVREAAPIRPAAHVPPAPPAAA